MNARNVFGKGFKSPMTLRNQYVWEEILKNAHSYILQLKCEGKSILQHRRKTFAVGFLINIMSYKNLALDLLHKENEPFSYFLPYKTSQDHVEITFSCIRSAGGWNNNPSALQFRWCIRKMLFRNSVSSSKNANCQELGEDTDNCQMSRGIFTLTHEKGTSFNEKVIDDEAIDEVISSFSYLNDNTFSHYQKNILYYIAGNAAKKFLDKFPCTFCEDLILNQDIFHKDHNYSLSPITDYLNFTNFKSRGKLKFVSTFIFDIILFSETCYQTYSAKMKDHNFKKEIVLKVQRHFISKIRNLKPEHPIIDTYSLESHEMKIIKFISSYYCTLRVYTQCKQMTQNNHGSKSALRHKLTKLILFNHV
ncbi:Transposable element P transposase [Aphis craccivora]|uniref:Transposable element P transposase n=1 Tax=Aphis craccivora TaxID=307492 RepID=A0A6G0X1J7_APHCR|nr:Transposable element P transposase [Aphis craccivora]